MNIIFCRTAFILCAAAVFPAGIYYVRFTLSQRNLIPAVLLIIVLLYFIFEQVKYYRLKEGNTFFFTLSLIILGLYAILFPYVPSLASAFLAFSALGCSILACYHFKDAISRAALPVIMILSLPMEDTLQFYLGYPLRLITAAASKIVLFPFGVDNQGTTLIYQDGFIEVDSPCSGLNGLWVFVVSAMVLSLLRKHNLLKTAANASTSVLATLIYNTVRTVLLFSFQAYSLKPAAGFFHDGAGAGAYIFTFFLYSLFFLLVLERKDSREIQNTKNNEVAVRKSFTRIILPGLYVITLIIAAGSGLGTLKTVNYTPVHKTISEYKWPSDFNGRRLLPLKLSESDRRYFERFPGKAVRFLIEGGVGEELLLRYVTDPTRMLHFTEDCYQAGGIEITRENPVQIAIKGLAESPVLWSVFSVYEGGKKYFIRQAIFSLSAKKSYSDASAWYWNTILPSGDRGPWLSVTWKCGPPGIKPLEE